MVILCRKDYLTLHVEETSIRMLYVEWCNKFATAFIKGITLTV